MVIEDVTRSSKYSKEVVPVNKIEFDPKNPNKMSAAQYQSLNYSMEKWGYIDPIVIDQNNLVANGEHRLKVMIDKGVKEVEVVRYEFKNDRERKLFRQTMNKLHGKHDPTLDADDILSIITNSDEERLEFMRLTAEQDEQNIFKLLNKNKEDTGKESGELTNEEPEPETNTKCPSCGFEF